MGRTLGFAAALTGLLCAHAQERPVKACRFDGFGADARLAELKTKSSAGFMGCSPAGTCVPVKIAANDVVVVFAEEGPWTCGYLVQRAGAGPAWVRSQDLRPIAADSRPAREAWIGTWTNGAGRIEIRAAGGGEKLELQGEAEWHGARGVVHTGDFAGEATPHENHLHFVEGGSDSCTIDFTLIGSYLVANDNQQCGGMNVRFWGVWRRGK